jgi:hypothetical protein
MSSRVAERSVAAVSGPLHLRDLGRYAAIDDGRDRGLAARIRPGDGGVAVVADEPGRVDPGRRPGAYPRPLTSGGWRDDNGILPDSGEGEWFGGGP